MKLRFLYRAFKARYRDQTAEFTCIRQTVRPSDTLCDIGANKGSYVYWLSRWATKGHVVAFEPQTRLASYLKQACDELGLRNVTVEAKAVSACAGTLTLHVPGTGDSPGASLNRTISLREPCHSYPVPVVSLDEYFDWSLQIGLLKIDVEGAELAVFKGAERILKQQSPLLIFECENRHLESGSVTDVFHYLQSLGYDGQFVHRTKLLPLSGFDAAVHQKQAGPRFWDSKDYCNNFVFTKPAKSRFEEVATTPHL